MFGGQKERKKEKEKGGSHFSWFLDLVYQKRVEEGKMSEKLYLLSKIYEDWVVASRRAKS